MRRAIIPRQSPPLRHQAQWLLVRYRLDASDSVALGIILYVPATETLYFRFQQNFGFIRPEDIEIVAEMGRMFEQLAVELGAATTFAWMESSLSNTVFAEGPFEVMVGASPEEALSELYERHMTTFPD